jgi:hypothetical protein
VAERGSLSVSRRRGLLEDGNGLAPLGRATRLLRKSARYCAVGSQKLDTDLQ